MKLLNIAALAAVAIISTGCSGCSTIEKTVALVNAPQHTTVDEKTVLAAELAYGAALDTVTAGAKDGRIKGADAAKVAEIIQKARPARKALEAALHAANDPSLLSKLNDFKELTGQLAAIGAK